MKKTTSVSFILSLAFLSASIFASFLPANAQKNKNKPTPTGPLLTRTTTRHENRRLAYGGTVTISGAPAGSITIEGWTRNEVDVTADIELHAPNETDLAKLALVNTFVVDDDTNHVRILTTGTHDQSFMKRLPKEFSKSLVGLPWKIDYRIKVPILTDLEVSGGAGPIRLSGVEGALHLNALGSDAVLSLTGGDAGITILQGSIYLSVPARSWHGLGADVKLASGNLTVELPAGFNAEINADVLRTGSIEIVYPNLEPRERNSITPRSIRARAGSGGATLTLTVGDGTIRIKQAAGGP